jgi:hypothetical protein
MIEGCFVSLAKCELMVRAGRAHIQPPTCEALQTTWHNGDVSRALYCVLCAISVAAATGDDSHSSPLNLMLAYCLHCVGAAQDLSAIYLKWALVGEVSQSTESAPLLSSSALSSQAAPATTKHFHVCSRRAVLLLALSHAYQGRFSMSADLGDACVKLGEAKVTVVADTGALITGTGGTRRCE